MFKVNLIPTETMVKSSSVIILLSILFFVLKFSKSICKYLYMRLIFFSKALILFSKILIFSTFSHKLRINSFSFNLTSGIIKSISIFSLILEILGIMIFKSANLSSILIFIFSSNFSM